MLPSGRTGDLASGCRDTQERQVSTPTRSDSWCSRALHLRPAGLSDLLAPRSGVRSQGDRFPEARDRNLVPIDLAFFLREKLCHPFFHLATILGLLPMSRAVARWLAASLVAAVATEAFVVAPGTTSVGAIGEGRRAAGVRPRRAPRAATPALRATAAGNVASPEAAAAAAAGGYEPAIRIGHGFDIGL